MTILLGTEVLFLAAFFVLGVAFGPFADSDAGLALLAAFCGIAAMALQNGVQRVHFASVPPTTIMTNNTTQTVLDGVDIARGAASPEVRARFQRTLRSIVWFTGGCAIAALLYYLLGFWSLALPTAAGAFVVWRTRQRQS
jgi:uncharacterized membrane protein YoaK (UPF0700 family)